MKRGSWALPENYSRTAWTLKTQDRRGGRKCFHNLHVTSLYKQQLLWSAVFPIASSRQALVYITSCHMHNPMLLNMNMCVRINTCAYAHIGLARKSLMMKVNAPFWWFIHTWVKGDLTFQDTNKQTNLPDPLLVNRGVTNRSWWDLEDSVNVKLCTCRTETNTQTCHHPKLILV